MYGIKIENMGKSFISKFHDELKSLNQPSRCKNKTSKFL